MAKAVRKLKLEDPGYWDPAVANYTPLIPVKVVKEAMEAFSRAFKALDEEVSSLLDLNYGTVVEDTYLLDPLIFIYKKIRLFLSHAHGPFNELFNQFVGALEYMNAFTVGLYNGLIEAVAGLLDFAGFVLSLFKPDKLRAFLDAISDFMADFFSQPIETLKKLISAYLQKFKDAANAHQVLALIGEDIGVLVAEVLMALATGGAKAAQALTTRLTRLANIVADPKSVMDDVVKALNTTGKAVSTIASRVKVELIILGTKKLVYADLVGFTTLARLFGGATKALFEKNTHLKLYQADNRYILFHNGQQVLDATENEIRPVLQDLVGKKGDELDDAINELSNLSRFGFRIFKFSRRFDDHIQYGHTVIRVKNSQTGKIVERYEYPSTSNKGQTPTSGFNYKVDVGGMHILRNLNQKVKILQNYGTKKLPTGDTYRRATLEFWVEELGEWVKKKEPSTFWPQKWGLDKIKEVTLEAAENIVKHNDRKFIGISSVGLQIEFWINEQTKSIETAYLKLKNE